MLGMAINADDLNHFDRVTPSSQQCRTLALQTSTSMGTGQENVVTPVIDYAFTVPEVDTSAIALLSFSFGGYLAPRESAFEHRFATTICLDGMYSFSAAILPPFGPEFTTLLKTGSVTAVNGIVDKILADPTTTTSTKWFFDQGL
ncbi:hypothetical protein G7Y89_g13928 [Cudoniella acicularis]|uniref:Uncharacterized protein n=1 Tax=Cudoniella acicularis TaxID=354080 RepID=A0A8H4R6B3_9HELO|nr:hypothetical protein G7Y89_g13928 [Cudoniella acicularis]